MNIFKKSNNILYDIMETFSCHCPKNNGKLCHLKLFLYLMNTKYYKKINSTVTIELIHNILKRYENKYCPFKIRTVNNYIKIKCCGGHNKNGQQCTKPIIEPEFTIKNQLIELSQCPDHFDQPRNQCDTLNYFTSIHQYSMCKNTIFNKYSIINNYLINIRSPIFNTHIDEKCKYNELPLAECVNYSIPIDSNNEIKFYCVKHHCKHLQNLYNEFIEQDIEDIRQVLQSRTSLLTYQSIMSKVRFLKRCALKY
jgi:hypothetical protein